MPLSPRIRHGMEYVLFRSLELSLSFLPRPWVMRIGATVGWVVGRMLRYRWTTTTANLRGAFPDRTAREIARIATQSYESIGTTLCELLWLPRLAPDRLTEIVRIQDPETLRAAYARGTGVIVLTAHYGSWEVLGQVSRSVLGVPGSLLVRGMANPFIDRRIEAIRRSFGNTTVPATLAVRDLLHSLRSGGWILMAADQSAPRESVTVPFFGREVPTFQGPALLALKTGAQIVLGLARRAPDGVYDIRYERVSSDDRSEVSTEAIVQLTARHVAATERAMMDAPEQWMWMHRRWKHAATSSSSDSA